ncbi:MAG: carboxypeptidase regulatory-like domain-containing protein [Planctomycetes bacterium]|nr:carboxypeptidase regulatory-like domain-containing protein [Planctomycetota bacterium]
MQSKSLLVALLAVLVLAALWFAFDGGNAPPPAAPAAPPASPSATAASAAAESAAGGTLAERPQAAAAAPVERQEVERAAAAAAPVYRVRGRLVDAGGRPRAGVAVEAMTWRAGEEDDIVVVPGTGSAATGVSATADRDGTFTLLVPAGRDGRPDLRGDELVFATEPAAFVAAKGDQDLGDLVVVRSSRLQGVVRDEAGRPVAEALVEASVGQFLFGRENRTRTGADGTFVFPGLRPGAHVLRTASSRFLPTTLAVDLAPEEQRTDLVLVLRQGNAIAGQVVDDRGVGVAGLKVGCKRKELRGDLDVERFSAAEATVTDQGGYFTLAGLPSGAVTLRAFGAGHTPVTASDVRVGTGDLVLRVQRLAVVEGVLTAADGTPLAGSRVQAEAASSQPQDRAEVDDLPFVGRRSVKTAADGTFRLESVEPGAITVVATGKGHLPARGAVLQIAPGQTVRGVRLVADAGATARVLVVDAAGEPVADAKVRVVPPRGARGDGMRFVAAGLELDEAADIALPEGFGRLGDGTTGPDGVAVVRGLPAGDASFEASHRAFAGALPATITVPRAGTIEVRLALREPGFVEVVARDADGALLRGAGVRLSAHDGVAPPKGATTDAEGRARIGPLAPGDYEAVLTRRAQPMTAGGARIVFAGEADSVAASAQPVTVVGGGTTQVELRQPRVVRLHGTLTGVDGPVAGGTVELERRGGPSLPVPGFGGRQARTGADGTFAFDDVEPGAWTLRFGRPNQLVKASQDVEVPAGSDSRRQDLVLRTGRVSVRVHTAGSGEPVEGAEVELVVDTGETGERPPQRLVMASVATLDDSSGESTTMTLGVQRMRTDAEGRAVVEDVPAGVYSLRVHHQGYASVQRGQQVVVEQQTTDCGRIDLELAGRIRCTVKAADGSAVPMAVVQSRPLSGGDWSDLQPAFRGSARLDALRPGRHALRARRPGSDSAAGPEVEVDVQAGKTADCELRLP